MLKSPTLSFSPARNFYLTGRARPLALLAPTHSFFARFALLAKGHAQGKAIDARRMVKEEDEIARMRRAGRVTALAMARVPALARPGVNERQIQDAILDVFRRSALPFPLSSRSSARGRTPPCPTTAATTRC